MQSDPGTFLPGSGTRVRAGSLGRKGGGEEEEEEREREIDKNILEYSR